MELHDQAATTVEIVAIIVRIVLSASGRLGLHPPPSELGFTRVRHFRVAEVGYIRLRLGEGWGGGGLARVFVDAPTLTLPRKRRAIADEQRVRRRTPSSMQRASFFGRRIDYRGEPA